jgi:hypothetical protein
MYIEDYEMTYSTQIEQQEASDAIAEQLELGQEQAEACILPAFEYDGNLFLSYEEACNAVSEKHPELLDDEMSDYFDSHISEL